MAPLAVPHVLGGVELQYISRRLALTGRELGSAVIANATFVSRTSPKGFELSGSVYNLFDKRYAARFRRAPAGGHRATGAHLRVRLT